jgi:hypothetical protein
MVMGLFLLVGRPLGDPLGAGTFLGARTRGLWGSFAILPGLGKMRGFEISTGCFVPAVGRLD